MALPKKGLRKIEHEGNTYGWRLRKRTVNPITSLSRMSLVIQQRNIDNGQLLSVRLNRYFEHQEVISSADIINIIKAATRKGWAPDANGKAFEFDYFMEMNRQHLIPMILDATPSFLEVCKNFDWIEDVYCQCLDIAKHSLALYRENKTAELSALANVIENFLEYGWSNIREFGYEILDWLLVECREEDIRGFSKFLLPKSLDAWHNIIKFRLGKDSKYLPGNHSGTA